MPNPNILLRNAHNLYSIQYVPAHHMQATEDFPFSISLESGIDPLM